MYKVQAISREQDKGVNFSVFPYSVCIITHCPCLVFDTSIAIILNSDLIKNIRNERSP